MDDTNILVRCAAAGHHSKFAEVFAPVPRRGPAYPTSTGFLFFVFVFFFNVFIKRSNKVVLSWIVRLFSQ